MLPRARDDHARPAHERQRHTMGDTCIPPTPNQLLTAILSSTMQSSCLFRLSSADCAACVHRSTAAAWPGPQVDSPISENLEGKCQGDFYHTTTPMYWGWSPPTSTGFQYSQCTKFALFVPECSALKRVISTSPRLCV